LSDEEKYLDIREKLKSLETVKASSNFTNNLHLKIVEEEALRRNVHIKKYDDEKGGFLRNLFSNQQYPWLIPAVGFTMVIFFIFYVTYVSVDIEQLEKSNSTTALTNESNTANNNSGLKNYESKNLSDLKNSIDNLPKENSENLKNQYYTDQGNLNGSDLNNEKKTDQSKPDLALVETQKRNVTSADNKDIDSKKTVEENERVNEPVARDNSSDNEMPLTEYGRSNKSVESGTDNRSESISPDDNVERIMHMKLDKIDKTGLENLRNKLVR